MIIELWTRLLESLGFISDEDKMDYRPSIEPADMHYPTLPDDVIEAMRAVREMRQDRDNPYLFVGKFINDRNIICEVISCTEDDFRVMILKIKWDRLGTYLDVGETYPLHVVYESKDGKMKTWEVDSETTKRSASQVLLQWEKGVGWSWDLDF